MAGGRLVSLTSFLRFSSAASKPTKAATTVRFAFRENSFRLAWIVCLSFCSISLSFSPGNELLCAALRRAAMTCAALTCSPP